MRNGEISFQEYQFLADYMIEMIGFQVVLQIDVKFKVICLFCYLASNVVNGPIMGQESCPIDKKCEFGQVCCP